VTLEATFRGVSFVFHKQHAFSVAAEASQLLPTSEKQITSFRTAESDPVSICYFIINFILCIDLTGSYINTFTADVGDVGLMLFMCFVKMEKKNVGIKSVNSNFVPTDIRVI
jgi:hypothetical protein